MNAKPRKEVYDFLEKFYYKAEKFSDFLIFRMNVPKRTTLDYRRKIIAIPHHIVLELEELQKTKNSFIPKPYVRPTGKFWEDVGKCVDDKWLPFLKKCAYFHMIISSHYLQISGFELNDHAKNVLAARKKSQMIDTVHDCTKIVEEEAANKKCGYSHNLEIKRHLCEHRTRRETFPQGNFKNTFFKPEKMLWDVLKMPVTVEKAPVFRLFGSNYESFKFLMQKLVERHRICPYQKYLNRICSYELDNKKKHHKFPKEYKCSSKQVLQFITQVLDHILPDLFLGSLHNRKIFLKHLRLMVFSAKDDHLRLGQFLQHMKFSDVKYLNGHSHVQKEAIFAKVILFLVETICVNMIKCFFHVTVSSNEPKQLAYYRHNVWRSIHDAAIHDHIRNGLLEEVTLLCSVPSNCSMRVLPKNEGVRLVFAQNKDFQQFQQSKHLLAILKYLAKIYEIEGAGESNMQKLESFIAKNKRYNVFGDCYIVKVDISNCFWTMDHEKLVEALKEPLQKFFLETFYVHVFKLLIFKLVGNEVKLKPVYFASKTNDVIPTLKSNIHSVHQAPHVYLKPQSQASYTYETLISALRSQISEKFTRVYKKTYRLNKGIIQGGQLSDQLCNIYYGFMENKYLTQFLSRDDCLVRKTDDYLYITKSSERAIKFFETMKEGIEEFNCYIREDKIEKNFEVLPTGKIILQPCDICWNGLVIDSHNLDLSKDYGLKIKSITSSTVFDYKNQGNNLKMKLMHAIQLPKTLVDERINTKLTVETNLFKMFTHSCIVMQSCINKFPHVNWNFILKMITKASFKAYRMMLLHVKRRKVKFSFSLTKVRWICLFAYHTQLQRKALYQEVLNSLAEQLTKFTKNLNRKKLCLQRKVFLQSNHYLRFVKP